MDYKERNYKIIKFVQMKERQWIAGYRKTVERSRI